MSRTTEQNRYTRVQSGNWIGIPILVLGVIPLGMALWLPHSKAMWALWVLPVLGTVAWLFRRFTIQVGTDELSWWFGGGWFRKAVALADIASVRKVRTSWMEGWGIHWSRYGWLYNIRGFDAVEVTLKDGKRMCLGTDEPDVLVSYLRSMERVR